MKVILVTESFPWGEGEQFLESELTYLVSGVDKLSILPLTIPAGPVRELPGEVELIKGYAEDRSSKARHWYMFRELAISLTKSVYLKELFKSILKKSRQPTQLPGALAEWIRSTHRSLLFERFIINRAKASVDLVYFYWCVPEVFGATNYSRSKNEVRVVSRAHGGDLYTYARHGPVDFFAYRSAYLLSIDLLAVISDSGRQYAQTTFGIPENKVATYRLGVEASRKLSQQPEHGLHIVSISFALPNKRLDRIVDALNILASKHPDTPIKWTHVGAGPTLAETTNRSATLPDNCTVVFAGHQDHGNVLDLLEREHIDVVVNVSENEGVPVSLMEAFAAGIPVVAPNIGGIEEMLQLGAGVLMSSSPEPNEIALALGGFFDKSNSAPLRRAAIETWRTMFDASKNYPMFVEEVIRNKPAVGARVE